MWIFYTLNLTLAVAVLFPAVGKASTNNLSRQISEPASNYESEKREIQWLSSVTPELRRFVHLNTEAVPEYPIRELIWDNVENWPKKVTVQGKEFKLQIQTHDADIIGIVIDSLGEVPPGSKWFASYISETGKWIAGPSYAWRSSGEVFRKQYKSWTGKDLVVGEYRYYKDGNLASYCPPCCGLQEYFRHDGALAGFYGSTKESHEIRLNGKKLPNLDGFLEGLEELMPGFFAD